MPDFVPGQRYPITADEAYAVLRAGWPITYGLPDLSRGRRFLKEPGTWEFWMADGRKVHFSVGIHGLIVSMSKQPDPDRPEPLPAE